jgi:sec-independent protein translocase protein TatA
MGLSWSHILIVLVLFVLLFGRGKISELMGDFAKGIKSFKKGLAEDDKTEEPAKTDPRTIDHQPPPSPATASGSPVTSGAGTEPRKVI